MRHRVTGAAAVALLAFGGCTVGNGSGQAAGPLWVTACTDGNDLGSAAAPISFDLHPSFFAAVPFDGLAQGTGQTNQLEIRMQSSGLSFLYTDTLYFSIESSFEVARCVRGRMANGQPDYNVTEPLPNNALTPALGGASPPATGWCDWTAVAGDGGAPDGGAPDAGTTDGGTSTTAAYPRIHLTPYTDVRSSIGLLASCTGANVTAEAIDGWIAFQDFGGAEENTLPPDLRTPVPANFIINFGDRLRGQFHVVLEDSRVIETARQNLSPLSPMIGGTLDGYFDFDLERGRGAQPFP